MIESDVSVLEFIEEYEPIGTVKIQAKGDKEPTEYPVMSPDNLAEENYIRYFRARAASIDTVRKYSVKKELEDGTVINATPDNPADILRMEAELHPSAKDMVAALLELRPTQIKLRPKTLIRVYNAIEEMLKVSGVNEPDEESVNEKPGEPESEKKG